jgi:guanylate kinase
MRRGFPIIISGPTGSGKTSVSQKIVKLDRGVKYSVSATTRPKRKGEREGRDYHFVGRKTFEEWIREDKFCEWAEVHDNYYGTLRNFIEQILSKGKEVVIDVDYQGRKALRKEYPDGVYIFLLPPTFSDLEKRLRKRGTESKEAIRKRLEGVEKELKGLKSEDYLVINRNITKTVYAVQMIIKSERLRGMRQNLQGWLRTGVRKSKSLS